MAMVACCSIRQAGPFHMLLGLANNALKCMEVIWSETNVMEDFYKYNNYRKGSTSGGEFVSKDLRSFISPESLEELGRVLGDFWIEYLSALRELYYVLVQPNLD